MSFEKLPKNSFIVRNDDGTISHIWVPEPYMSGFIWVKYIPE